MTKCDDQFAVMGFTYGTMIFMRRQLVGKMEFKAKAWFEPFEVSRTGGGLLVLELTRLRSEHPVLRCTNVPTGVFTDSPLHKLLVATSHLDYTPETRATQFVSATSTLSATPTSVFCGDTNIDTYPELEPLLPAGYVDSWLEMHTDVSNSPDLRAVGVKFVRTGLYPLALRRILRKARRLGCRGESSIRHV